MRNVQERTLLGKDLGMSSEDDSVDFKPHRVPVTVLTCVIGAGIIVGSIALLFQRNTFIGKRKAVQYMALSSLGLLFYLRDTADICWTYPEYNNNVSTTYMYYLIAVPFHYLPVIVRSWRIFCVYRTTPTWQCKMEPITSRRKRGHQWMLTRIGVLYIPWVITAIGLVWNPNIPYYVYIGLNGIAAISNIVLTVLLYNMRLELRPKYLDETSSLLVFSVLSLIEWAFANTIYVLALLIDISNALVYYMYIELILIGLMWSLTTGKLVYRVYVRKDLKGDRKPELETKDIQKALQRVSVKLEPDDYTKLRSNNTLEEGTYGRVDKGKLVELREVEDQKSGTLSSTMDLTTTSEETESDVQKG